MGFMISIEFTDEVPKGKFLWGSAIYDTVKREKLAPVLEEALRCKPHEPVIEAFLEQEGEILRHLVIRIGANGKSKKQDREAAGAALYKKAAGGIEKSLLLDLRQLDEDGLDLLTGILLSSWRFDKYRTSLKDGELRFLEKIIVLSKNPIHLEKRFRRTNAVVSGVHLARALTSEPSNILYPIAYAEKLKELSAYGLEIEILNEEALRSIGMTALLAVGQGSGHQACVAVIKWKGACKDGKPIVIVGKGVCFDSGGLCIKPAVQQQEMKWDKAGAGVVAGLMQSLAMSNSSAHVIGIVGLVENMPDGRAIKPGDVIRTMSGQTIEIVDTDAEGRLVLADCLWYAQQTYRPKSIIDLGTLTPETFASLGSAYAGLYCNNAELIAALLEAGENSGDLLWRLPMGNYFAKQIESSVADIKNLGEEQCGENGAAAEFLKRFVTIEPWAHIDIAGVSWAKDDLPLCSKGVTGYGVRLLEEWIESQSPSSE
jgi:leucyl aminopeptidase